MTDAKQPQGNDCPSGMQEPRVAAGSPDDFACLLAMARQGNAAALEKLIRHYEHDLRVVARVRLGPALRPYVDSMDLVQSVHHSLIRGLREDRFDICGPDDLLALAIVLLRGKIARHWRRHRRQRRHEGMTPETELLARADSADDPARVAQLHDQFHHVFQHLGKNERRLIELRMQNWNTTEAARRLGQKPTSCRARLMRLRRRLRQKGILPEQ